MMKTLASILTAFIAIEHVGILVLEMFFWDHPFGRRVFGMSPEVSGASAVLAMNQGLYNGFLAVGLIWSLLSKRLDVRIFFLSCVVIAGLFGGATAKASILITQAFPAAVAVALTIWLIRDAGSPESASAISSD
jgi:putative membrane protein